MTGEALRTRLWDFGRVCFAIGFIGLGTDHFLLGDFVTGRAPAWPAGIPGRGVWAYGTGIAIIAAGIAVLLHTGARTAALVRVAAFAGAGLVGGWAVLRHLLVLPQAATLSAAWTQAGKAAVFTTGCLMVAAVCSPGPLQRDRAFVTAGRMALAGYLVLTGIQHFLFVSFVAGLIPTWFPGDATFWTYAAGVALIVFGLGLALPRTAFASGSLAGLMVFSWFFIVHVTAEFAGRADRIAVYEALAVAGLLWVAAASAATGPTADVY